MRTINLGTLDATGTLPSTRVNSEVLNLAIQLIATGDPTAVTVDLEGSLDGLTWGIVESLVFSAGELTSLCKFSYIVDKPMPLFRLNISTLTFTTAGDLTAVVRFDD